MTSSQRSHHVAVIGLACRFPGAPDATAFWRNLRDGVESISFFDVEELTRSGVPSDIARHPNYVPAKAVLDDVDRFDAAYFGFTPREAELMDPQHRLFLECASEALEDAGYDFHNREARVGVYGGAAASTWLLGHLLSRPDLLQTAGALQLRLGNGHDFLTSQVSYRLNLRGPSVTVQSACSTSLVAVHLACQALLDGECDMALAGGVAISFPLNGGYIFQEEGIWSPDGHCRPFDAAAHGTVEGNGAGIVVLKRFDDALADRDTIRAVIRGSAVNNDGAQKSGYTAPSIDAQSRVIAEALAMAEVHPDTIGCVEGHGSGTPLGDPIEVRALTLAFRASTSKRGFCYLGSVKSNVGHLDNAAGIASLIKMILALEHAQVPPTLHFTTPNPRLELAASPFLINTGLVEWPRGPVSRRGAVSSLGIGGTNAHVVLEEAPAAPMRPADARCQLLTLSARRPEALDALTDRLAAHFDQHPGINLADVSYTVSVGRRAWPHRRAVLATSAGDAAEALQRARESVSGDGRPRRVAFLFPGLGDQVAGIADAIYRQEPGFRERLDRCADLLRPALDVDIREALFPRRPPADGHAPSSGADRLRRMLAPRAHSVEEPLAHTSIAQPAVFAVEYALAGLFEDWGIRPAAMIGYSLGEYTAACLSGVFSLEDALGLVARRARLISTLPQGAMLAVPLAADDVEPWLDQSLSVAVSGSPAMTVISGAAEHIAQFERRLADRAVASRRLSTTHAFHSSMVDGVVQAFRQDVSNVALSAPTIPYVSNVTGTWMTAADAMSPDYWARHLRQTVRFSAGLEALLTLKDLVLLEMGPGQTLTTLARQHPAVDASTTTIPAMRDRSDDGDGIRQLRSALGRLWESGVPVDWDGYWKHESPRRVPLPTYPFERRSCWIEPGPSGGLGPPRDNDAPRLDIADWFYVPTWHPAPVDEERAVAGTRWLLFVDEAGVGVRVAELLRSRGERVATVARGIDWQQLSDDRFVIAPGRREHYVRLLQALHPAAAERIAHLWSVSGEHEIAEGPWDQDRGFYSLLFLAQAIGERETPGPLRVDVISSDVQDVTGHERLRPEKAAVLGPVKVIPQELGQVTCRSIDIDRVTDAAREAQCQQILLELTSASNAQFVSWRGRRRWIKGWGPMRVERHADGPPRLEPQGVCLIAGGLDPTGVTVAEYLARRVNARLVLAGPATFPARDTWERWLQSHDDDDSIARSIRRLRALELTGTQLLIRPVSVADAPAMRRIAEEARERFAAIDGVIHAAGEPGAGLIQLKTFAMSEQVLAPKLVGTRVLEEVTSGIDLDFFIVFSSLTAIAGGVGQVDTCAAGAFLDAFAHARANRSRCLVASVNWSPFEWDTWNVPATSPGEGLDSPIKSALQSSAIGAAALGIALDGVFRAGRTQVAVSPHDLDRVLEQTDAMTAARLIESIASVRSSSSHSRPQLAVPYCAPRTPTERTIAAVWGDAFGLDGVGVHDGFFDLSGNSLLAIQIITRLRTAFGIELSMTALFESPTVERLAQEIDRLRGAAPSGQDLEALLDEVERLSPAVVEAHLAGDADALSRVSLPGSDAP